MLWSFSLWRPEFPEGHDESVPGRRGINKSKGRMAPRASLTISDATCIGWEGQIHSWRASQFSRFRRSAVTDHQRKGDDWVSEDELCVKNTLNPCSRVLVRLGSETRTDDPSFKSNGPLLFAKMSAGRRHFRCTRGGGHEQL